MLADFLDVPPGLCKPRTHAAPISFHPGSISGLFSLGFCPRPVHKDVIPSLFHFMAARQSPMDDIEVTSHLWLPSKVCCKGCANPSLRALLSLGTSVSR